MKKFFLILLLLPFFVKAQENTIMIQGGGSNIYVNHIAAPKENFYSIGRLYNISPKEIAPFNKLSLENGLNIGQTVKVPLQSANFTQTNNIGIDEIPLPVFYKVEASETIFQVSSKFNKVSVASLKKWNNLDDLNVDQGSKIAVVGEEDSTKETANKAEVKITEHVVVRGENLGSIARKYDVAVSDIKDWNNLQDTNVQLGAKLIVGKKYIITSDNKNTISRKEGIAVNNREQVKLYYVKKGDSLFSIAKKYPGVSISDLKKWNGIKSESLKAGMRLKING